MFFQNMVKGATVLGSDKGKGNGKGKSSVISVITPNEQDTAKEIMHTSKRKRASKRAPEIHKNTLNDVDNNDAIMTEKDSQENVSHGQNKSDADSNDKVQGTLLNYYLNFLNVLINC